MKIYHFLALLLSVAAPSAMAAPICGETPRIAELRAAWGDANGPLMVASHRGGHIRAPENSLAAIDEAIEAGADFIEIDVHVTSDGVPYILHDRTLDRTTNDTGPSEEVSYAELRALRLKGGDTPPPTLLEILRHSCGRVLIDLDMKTDRIAPVVAVITGLGMADQVMMFDGDSNALRTARSMAPDMPVMTRLRKGEKLDDINAGLSPVGIVHGDEESLTQGNSAAIKAISARIWANSLGPVDELIQARSPKICPALKAMEKQGVSVIQTDYPADLRYYIAQCGLGESR